MRSKLSEWRRLRILMERIEDWDSVSPKVFLMFWKHAVWESQAAARRFDHNPPIALYLQPWTVTIACLPAMKARHLCNSLRAILNLSITCASLRRLCCRELMRWWKQIRRAVVNEEVNGKYLDGMPFATIVRLASSVGSGFATTTIRERGPQRRTLESDNTRSLELWPDEEEPESGSSSSECPWALEDEPGPTTGGSSSSALHDITLLSQSLGIPLRSVVWFDEPCSLIW